MAPGQLWKVVGGEERGGILVREGRDLSSAELPRRLATAALVREVELAGDRLSYDLVSGDGPPTGWVSLRLKDKDLLVIAEPGQESAPSPGGAPVVACFYSGGCTAAQGSRMLAGLTARARKEGFADVVVLDHIGEPGFESCEDWDAYIECLLSRLDADAGRRGRDVVIVAHSHGALPAYGLAKRLGRRCRKLYPIARRPPTMGLLDDVWGVDAAPRLAELDDAQLLRRMLDAWPNEMLERYRHQSPLPAPIQDVLKVVRRQYSSPAVPCGSADAPGVYAADGEVAVEAPILAVAASMEQPQAETAEKMERWRDFTKSNFDLKTVDASHMKVLNDATFDIIFSDMAASPGR